MHSNVDTLTILTFKVRYQDSRYTYEKTDFFIHAAENSPLSNQISNQKYNCHTLLGAAHFKIKLRVIQRINK